jgi:hypothetical protein
MLHDHYFGHAVIAEVRPLKYFNRQPTRAYLREVLGKYFDIFQVLQ